MISLKIDLSVNRNLGLIVTLKCCSFILFNKVTVSCLGSWNATNHNTSKQRYTSSSEAIIQLRANLTKFTLGANLKETVLIRLQCTIHIIHLNYSPILTQP